MKPIVPVATFAALLTLLASAPGFDITNCNVVVPENDVAVLTADMDCTGGQVAMRAGSTLQLAGHTLQGDADPIVWCVQRRCTITGPGAIVGDGNSIGIYLANGASLYLSDVELRDHEFGVLGTSVGKSKLHATNVTARACTLGGLHASRIKATGVRILESGGTFQAALHGQIVATDIEVRDSADVGVRCVGGCRLTRATVTGNASVGIRSTRRVALTESTVIGNDSAGAGIDIESALRPRLRFTTCGRSQDSSGLPWGVCASD